MVARPLGLPALNPGAPRQVTIIGHNSQIVPTVGFFVGGGIPVRVYTANQELEDQLAPYPGVHTSVIPAEYGARPADLPEPPYFVGVEDMAVAERIESWLPPTTARFLIRPDHRRQATAPRGFLTLLPPQADNRQQVLRRLAALKRVDTLMDLARGKRQPLILMYSDPDPDAVGAALGLATIWKAAGTVPLIRYTGEVQRYQNKLLLTYLKYPIEQLHDDELDQADLVAVVDAQPGFWRDQPPRAHVIIDHHPRREDTSAPYVDLRESYGSTSTIITEYLVEADIPLNRQLATALIYGIVTDTDNLKRNASSADIRAFDLLHERADRNFLARLEKSQVPMSMLDYIAWGISHRVVYGDMVLIHFGRVPTVDICVQVADLVLLTCGITWVVCAAVHDDRLIAVFRGDGHRQNVGKRASLAFSKIGSAGGHHSMGRAEIPLEGASVEQSIEILVTNLFRRMSPARRARFMRILKGHLMSPPPMDPDGFELTS
ncbi:MAG: bifunctional oligoribonuclease/PAP phosphatase NrnA [Planctomycetes bacterium]|nr:bifunctional oligoribonuclease/PAP phosphatase NrnA [Planctomycetota bacterium]